MIEFLFPKRLGQLSYFLRVLPHNAFTIVAAKQFEQQNGDFSGGILVWVGVLAVVLYGLAFIYIPRARDCGMPGWIVVFGAVPFFSSLLALVLLCKETSLLGQTSLPQKAGPATAKPLRAEFCDSELGVLTLDCGVWGGTVQRDGKEIRFHIAGTASAPDAGLVGRVGVLLVGFADVERRAMEFLRSREAALSHAQLSFYSFDFLWEGKPDDFAFEFLAGEDESRVWRVEFVAGQPSGTGFDD